MLWRHFTACIDIARKRQRMSQCICHRTGSPHALWNAFGLRKLILIHDFMRLWLSESVRCAVGVVVVPAVRHASIAVSDFAVSRSWGGSLSKWWWWWWWWCGRSSGWQTWKAESAREKKKWLCPQSLGLIWRNLSASFDLLGPPRTNVASHNATAVVNDDDGDDRGGHCTANDLTGTATLRCGQQ